MSTDKSDQVNHSYNSIPLQVSVTERTAIRGCIVYTEVLIQSWYPFIDRQLKPFLLPYLISPLISIIESFDASAIVVSRTWKNGINDAIIIPLADADNNIRALDLKRSCDYYFHQPCQLDWQSQLLRQTILVTKMDLVVEYYPWDRSINKLFELTLRTYDDLFIELCKWREATPGCIFSHKCSHDKLRNRLIFVLRITPGYELQHIGKPGISGPPHPGYKPVEIMNDIPKRNTAIKSKSNDRVIPKSSIVKSRRHYTRFFR